jgi:sugar lactone lactonase YvrE
VEALVVMMRFMVNSAALATFGMMTSAEDLPCLNVDGFSWAENLAFDGLGNLFVSDAIRGELWRIYLSENKLEYISSLHLNEGIKDIGGVQITPDGTTIYAGATLANKSHAIISTPTTFTNGEFEVLAVTKNKPNGFAGDWKHNILYCTDEGTGSDEGGTVTAFDIASRTMTLVKDFVTGADGAWLDGTSDKLFVGELLSMKMMAFDTSTPVAKFLGEYDGLTSLGVPHMLDDFTLESEVSPDNLGETAFYGTDWTGRKVMRYTLDGKGEVFEVPPPSGIELYEPTSVRRGKGPGFDPDSLYVTEGGGVLPSQTNRRVLQLKTPV